MNRIEQIKQLLEELELSPVVYDNVIVVAYEMKYIEIHTIEAAPDADESDEDKYITVQLNRLYDIEDESEIVDILVTCNKLNRDLRQIKTYISEDLSTVNTSFEFWFNDDDDLCRSIMAALMMFSTVKTYFFQQLRAINKGSETPDDIDDNDAETEKTE